MSSKVNRTCLEKPNSCHRIWSVPTSVCLALLFAAATALGQSSAERANISGTILNPAGTPVPAQVTATNWRTGSSRSSTASASGEYRFDALEPGVYQVKASSTGFAAATVADIVIVVGGSAQINLTMGPQTTVVVSDAAASFVRVAEANAGQVILEEAIFDLPTNGRRFQDFATLTPAVHANDVTRGQLSFVGQRGINSNVLLDGSDYNEPFTGGIRGGERSPYIFTVPQIAIEEFQAVTAGYTAEYGRSTGGVLNVITRSGGNSLTSQAFYQLRDPSLGLNNPYVVQSLERQHQFGGAVGGPIRRNKTFFFVGGEDQIASFPRTVHFSALDALAGNVTPDIAPGYNYLRSLEQPFRQTNDGFAILGRIDHRFTDRTDISLRYNTSASNGQNAVSFGNGFAPETNVSVASNGTESERTQTASARLTHLFGSSALTELRGQYSRESHGATSNSSSPAVIASVIGATGGGSFLPNHSNDYRAQVSDSVDWIHGTHSVRTGVEYSRNNGYQDYGFNQNGAFTIESSDPTTILRTLSASGGGANRFDSSSVIYSRLIGNRVVGGSDSQLALFAQDSWRVRRDLTIEYGLRWDAQWNPQPAVNNAFLLSNIRDFTFPQGKVDPTVIRNQLGQFGPRLGFAWNVAGKGKTVVRAQSGVFYAQTPLGLLMDPLNNLRLPRGNISLNLTPSGTSTVYSQLLAGGIDLNRASLGNLPVLSTSDVQNVVGPSRNPYAGSWTVATSGNNFRNPRSVQLTAGLEHELAPGLILSYQYFHVNTVHLERNIDYNVPEPVVRPGDASLRPFFGLRSGNTRPNPNIGFLLVRDSGARSMYNGHTLGAHFQKNRWQLAANYTLSFTKSDDDNEADPWATSYFNPYDLRREYNWSLLDSRHQVSSYARYSAPWGIELSGIGRYRSGMPFDAGTGADTSELLGRINSLLPFSNYGNRPLQSPGVPYLRDAFRNRDYKSVDFRIMKTFKAAENMRVQLSAETFNLFNFRNILFHGNGFIYGPGVLANGQQAPADPRFMRLRNASGGYDPSTTVQQGGPFQAQLGVRLLF